MEHWYALYTKPHKEYQVSSFLESKGYETYLPTMRVRKNGKEKSVPFFSCYLFIHMDASLDFSQVGWTPGLRAIVSFGGQRAVVPDNAIHLMRQRLAQLQGSVYPTDLFRPGDRVVAKSGPLRDFEGVFERSLSSRNRARVLVDFLGRWTPCEVEIDCLEKAR